MVWTYFELCILTVVAFHVGGVVVLRTVVGGSHAAALQLIDGVNLQSDLVVDSAAPCLGHQLRHRTDDNPESRDRQVQN